VGLPEPAVQSDLILRGQVEELDLATLLTALRLGRQYLTLDVFDAAGEHAGSVSVKSGRVVSAVAGDQTGADAVRQLLDSSEVTEFRVRRQTPGAELADEPVGAIADLAELRDPSDEQEEDAQEYDDEADADGDYASEDDYTSTESEDEADYAALPSRTRILQGVLNERLTLEDVLRVVGFTRQHVSVELSDQTGLPLGEVRAKSGKILSVHAGDTVDVYALRQLLDAPPGSKFVLFTDEENVSLLQPLGSFVEVLGAARELGGGQSNGFRKTLPPPLPQLRGSTGEPPPPRARILEGSLDEFELSHVLRVLSTSRQQFELHVRDDAAASAGVIEVKAGNIIAASTEKLTGVPAARELLGARSGRFVAIRRAEAKLGDRPSLLSVSELLQPKAASPEALGDTLPSVQKSPVAAVSDTSPAALTPVHVLDGKLGELDVASILRVAAASRQYTCVHIFNEQRQPIGVIHVKGGHIVRAKAQDTIGVDAVRRLVNSPREYNFLVQRYPNAPKVTSSIGSLAEVLERAGVGPSQGSSSHASSASGQPYLPRTITSRSLQAVARSVGGPSNSWIGGAVLGAGFVLLGGVATALVMRTNPPPVPTVTQTSVSPATAPPEPAAAPQSPATEPTAESATPAANSGTATPDSANAQLAPGVPAAKLSRAAIASVQAGLRQLGYETGPIDGVVGPRTTAAIKAFQYAEHLAVDGTLSPPTRAVLLRRIDEP
jgi:hypothetical protein